MPKYIYNTDPIEPRSSLLQLDTVRLMYARLADWGEQDQSGDTRVREEGAAYNFCYHFVLAVRDKLEQEGRGESDADEFTYPLTVKMNSTEETWRQRQIYRSLLALLKQVAYEQI